MKSGGRPRSYEPYFNLFTSAIIAFLLLPLFCPAELQAKPVSGKQARKAVKKWLKVSPNPLRTQMGNQVRRTDVFTDDNSEPIYYVIYLQPAGFVITAADDLIEPIIAFAGDGTYDPSPDNPLGALVSGDLPGRIAAVRGLQASAGGFRKKPAGQRTSLEKASLRAENKWAGLSDDSNKVGVEGIPSISDVRVAPLLQSEWGQTWACYTSWYCYNYYTPSHWPCGCVATAMAQLMRYHEHPGSYVWSNMPLRPEESCGTLTEAQRMAIGDLCYDAAESVETIYGSGSSTAQVWKVRDALPNVFGYSNAIDGWYNNEDLSGPALNGMINPNLDAGYPSLLGIFSTGIGHAVVADGYGYQSSTLYHHLNMGWDGTDNVWYNLPYVDAYYYYDNVEECIYNIYTSGSGEIISGRVTDTLDGPISGALVTGTKSGGGVYTDTTNSNGIYALAKIPSASTYTVSVTKSGYSFTNQVVSTGTSTHDVGTSGNKWGIDFIGTETGPTPPTADSNTVSVEQGEVKTIDLQGSDDGLPNPPGALTYIITSLPTHGTLDDAGAGAIESVPYILVSNGNQVVYTPFCAFAGSDSFSFKVNDGGTPPEGGDSDTATISISVQPSSPTVVYETDFSVGLPSGWSIVDGGSSSDTWTYTNPGGRSREPWWTEPFMIVDNDYAGAEDMDEQLITHSIDCSNLMAVTLRFKHYFRHWGDEICDVDIRVGGGSWQNAARYETVSAEGQVELDLSSIADGSSDVQIRWHYYNAYWAYYWGIDDVEIIASVTSQGPVPGDFEPDCDVDFDDLTVFVEQWLCETLSADFTGGDHFIDFSDWAVFAQAWQSTTSSPNWNSACDIFPEGGDGIVDMMDLASFAGQWLQFDAYSADIAPVPEGDGIVDILDFAVFAQDWFTGVE